MPNVFQSDTVIRRTACLTKVPNPQIIKFSTNFETTHKPRDTTSSRREFKKTMNIIKILRAIKSPLTFIPV